MRRSEPAAKQAVPRFPLQNDADASEFWHDYFEKRKLEPAVINQLVLRLHNAKKYEHVIAVIEAALVNGQSQPWMYEVLALTMQIAGRPQHEIDRVLLSRVDFTSTDVPSMLFSAAYLTRLGGHQQALRLYQQASQIDPTRHEPYILGLKLARRFYDTDAVRWAASGILTFTWTGDYERLHRQAEDAASEIEQKLIEDGQKEAAQALHQAMIEAHKRDLALRLTWSGDGDLDLIVEEPLGTVCSFQNPHSRGGGALLHDGYGPNQKNCYEHYVCVFGVAGDYRIRIRHVAGNIVGKRAKLTIIRYQGSPNEESRTYRISISKKDKVVRLSLNQGRRTHLKDLRR